MSGDHGHRDRCEDRDAERHAVTAIDDIDGVCGEPYPGQRHEEAGPAEVDALTPRQPHIINAIARGVDRRGGRHEDQRPHARACQLHVVDEADDEDD